ncbi:putative RNA methyltransferase pc1998 [Vitis vinifera]|uniref:Putative RNA methyltransferase pc1998 n=1 Tax=Vitis vinifera TaxID=29760 RepID=A0A438EB40_VITVI|nr:putative RNA methyltransferase pc1998 [Vitis vinifera]
MMTLSILSAQPSAPPLPTSFPPSPNPNPNLSLSPLPSLTCALQCQHFQSCSGCTQELNLHRPIILDDVTDFFNNHGVSDFTFDSCRLWGWRCRAKLAVRGSSNSPLIGLYQENSHNIVDIPHCKAHHPSINATVELLKQGITHLKVEPYDEDQGTGELRYVQMAVTMNNTSLPASQRYRNGKVQVTLVWNSRNENSPSSEKLKALANFLWRNGGPRSNVHLIHSVWANFQTSTNNVETSFRRNRLLEHVGGIDIALAPSSFGQANTRAFDSLLHQLQKYVPYGAAVADLYAGAGVIGLSLAATRKCRQELRWSVKCIEINKEAKLSFEKTVGRLPKSIDSTISWHHADTSIGPLSWLVGSDVVVVDPPRKGLDPSLVDALRTLSLAEKRAMLTERSFSKVKNEKRPWILRAKEASVQIESKTSPEEGQSLPKTLIYISCGWESFKEDCKSLLSRKEWHLDKAHGFNFFPGTQSIEVLAVFKRGPGAGLKKKKSGKRKKRPL